MLLFCKDDFLAVEVINFIKTVVTELSMPNLLLNYDYARGCLNLEGESMGSIKLQSMLCRLAPHISNNCGGPYTVASHC